jgi:putative addiction module killer protein
MLPLIQVHEYLDRSGQNPYAEWFNRLNAPAAAKVATAVIRMSHGNLSNVKSVGAGVLEYKLDFGPGYRIYFGRDGERLILLLGGGSKKRQPRDIQNATERWQDYKQRKK